MNSEKEYHQCACRLIEESIKYTLTKINKPLNFLKSYLI